MIGYRLMASCFFDRRFYLPTLFDCALVGVTIVVSPSLILFANSYPISFHLSDFLMHFTVFMVFILNYLIFESPIDIEMVGFNLEKINVHRKSTNIYRLTCRISKKIFLLGYYGFGIGETTFSSIIIRLIEIISKIFPSFLFGFNSDYRFFLTLLYSIGYFRKKIITVLKEITKKRFCCLRRRE
jgi:hypothetical protein